jgi:hypothetical protein
VAFGGRRIENGGVSTLEYTLLDAPNITQQIKSLYDITTVTFRRQPAFHMEGEVCAATISLDYKKYINLLAGQRIRKCSL